MLSNSNLVFIRVGMQTSSSIGKGVFQLSLFRIPKYLSFHLVFPLGFYVLLCAAYSAT